MDVAGPEMLTLVTPVLLKVAVFNGTIAGVQLRGVFQSLVALTPVASWAWVAFGTRLATALKHTLPRSAARLNVPRVAAAGTKIAPPSIAARGAAARGACERPPYERIPQPLRAAPAAHPDHRRAAVPRARIVAPRPTLRAEPVTINSRSSVSARIADSCGFVATPPLFRHYARFRASSARST